MIKLGVTDDINDLLAAFDIDHDGTLSAVYTSFRSSFIQFGKRYSQDQELIVDSFQEAVISLYENLMSGNVTDQESSIKTYLYAIGKHKILNAQKKKNNQLKLIIEKNESEESQKEKDDADYQKALLSQAFDGLGERCRDVLIKFYYGRYSIDAIMIAMDYKNENTVKAHKSRCLAQLKEIVKNTKEI